MDSNANSSEKIEEVRAALRTLLNPQSFLEKFGGDVSKEDRASLISDINDIIKKNLGSTVGNEPPVNEMDKLAERFDAILGCASSYFPDGLPTGSSQRVTDPNTDKVLDELDPVTAKYFERELKFAGGLRNHDLAGFLNSPATDTGNAMPEGRSALPGEKATAFTYKPLNQSTDASRLVVLHPGGRDDEIKCDLVPLPLSVLEPPDDETTEISRYEALSYVWGSPADPLQTVAWLGPATWGSDIACLAIQAFQTAQEGSADILEPEQRNINTSLFGSNDGSSPQSNADEGFVHVMWDQFDQLLERPFFSRSWVVQEIVLAQHVTIYCGNMAIPYGILVLASIASSRLRQSLGFNTYTPLKTGFSKFFTFFTLCMVLRTTNTEIPLFHLASRFGYLFTTDPRDKIYAFLSLSPTLIQEGTLLDYGFSPDYGKSNLDVHRDFTLFCIKKYNNLNFLSRPFLNDDQHPLDLENWVDDWPSWVPDWDRRGIREKDFGGIDSLGQNPFRSFNAAGWWEDVEVAEVDGRTIAFAGVEFDEIAAVVEGDIFVDPKSVEGGEEPWVIWESFALGVGDKYGDTVEDKEEAFWRTLVADSDGNGSFAPEEFGEMFRCWRSNTPLQNCSPMEMELYESFIDQMFNTTRGRKLFLQKGDISV